MTSGSSRKFRLHYLVSLNGGMVVRPLFFDFVHDTDTYAIDQQFLLGDAILVAPALYQVRNWSGPELSGTEMVAGSEDGRRVHPDVVRRLDDLLLALRRQLRSAGEPESS